MSLAQDRLVVVALAVSESTWLYALFGLWGLAFGTGGPPLGWPAVLGVLGASLLVGRALNSIVMPSRLAYVIQMALGALVIHLTLGAQIAGSGSGIDLGWIGTMISGTEMGGDTRWGVLASIFAVSLWWRGGAMAASEYPTASLVVSFRVGILALAVAAMVDFANDARLNVFPMMFVFFASALAGLAVGHLLPASPHAPAGRAWPRVIGGVVAGILVIGLMFSALQKSVLSLLAAPALAAMGVLAKVFFFVVVVPLVYILSLIARAVIALVSPFLGGERLDFEGISFQSFGEQLLERREAGSAFLSILEWTLLSVLVLVVLYILARAFRRRVRWRRSMAEGARESLMEEADPAHDVGKLLFGLLPRRFKRRARRRRFLRLPEDDPNVADVFRIYFGLLVLAEDRGLSRGAAETPIEYQRKLESVFPGDLVRRVTAAFNRACYGHHPATRDQIEEMRSSVERLGSRGR